VNLIVLVDNNWAIGRDGNQLIYIPQDLKRFKILTAHHPIIVGRKTFNTFPNGEPLPNRQNIVLSSKMTDTDDVKVYHTVKSLLHSLAMDKNFADRAFVVGGASVYRSLLPYCDTAFVTKVQARFHAADRYIQDLDRAPNWKVLEKSKVQKWKDLNFQYITYLNKKKRELP